jgi:hypothetical protein
MRGDGMTHLEGLSDAEFLVWLRNRLIHRYAEQSDIVDRLTRMAEWLRLEVSPTVETLSRGVNDGV